jgi:hypothetical protein
VVDLLLFITFISMKNKNFFNRKGLKSFRSFLRDKATAAESTNQPPRPQIDFVISDFNCTAAAPPSKGGETFSTFRFYNSTLKLTPMPEGGLNIWLKTFFGGEFTVHRRHRGI